MGWTQGVRTFPEVWRSWSWCSLPEYAMMGVVYQSARELMKRCRFEEKSCRQFEVEDVLFRSLKIGMFLCSFFFIGGEGEFGKGQTSTSCKPLQRQFREWEWRWSRGVEMIWCGKCLMKRWRRRKQGEEDVGERREDTRGIDGLDFKVWGSWGGSGRIGMKMERMKSWWLDSATVILNSEWK